MNPHNFIAEVRNLKDPWESGRVQVRIYGRHDDEQNIKDEDLPWAMVLMPITSASTNRVGTSPTGLLVGSRVTGYFLDDAHQYPVIIGSFHRAGKLKDEDDNTGGKDDIDEKYSDVPISAIGSPGRTDKTNTQAKKTTEKEKKYDTKKEPKYNKNDYVNHDDGEDALAKSREKHAKTADKATVGSLNKTDNGDILQKILKVDGQNDAGSMPQAPQMFQQIMQMSSMTSGGGINGLMGGALGGSLGGIAGSMGNMGVGNILGSFSSMLGIDISMLSGMTGQLGSLGGGGSGGGTGGISGGASAAASGILVPQTPEDIAVTAAELLNQLGGYKTSTDEISGLSLEDKEALYTALLNLMNSVSPDLNVNTTITTSSSNQSKLILQSTPPQVNLEIVISDSPVITTQIVLPGDYVADIELIPDGYFPVYYFTDVDPYPGYMEWEGPEGERVFCPRPEDRPYVGTPEEDTINAGILAMINDILALIMAGKLTLAKQIEIMQNGRDAITSQGNQNTHGKGNNVQNIIQQLLGVLGQFLGQMQSNQLGAQDSVLQQNKINQTLEDYKKKNADVRKKKKLAKQAVQQKNESQNMMNNNMLGFGGMSGGGGGGSKGSPAGGSNAPSTNKMITYITKTGNTVKIASGLNPQAQSNAVSFGYYTIYKT